jgi:hypothetical protein
MGGKNLHRCCLFAKSPTLLSWLETSGRLVEDEESSTAEVSTVEKKSSLLSWARKRITTLPMSNHKRIGKIDLRSLP